MSKDQTTDLVQFLAPFPGHVKETTLWLREFVWDLYPRSNELIYDNYNALALGWSPTGKQGQIFCSIAVYSNHVNFGFYWGSEIADPKKILLGKGSQYRYIPVAGVADFPKTYIKKLLKEAYANSFAKIKDRNDIKEGMTITKSVAPLKRRPGMLPGKKKK